MTVEGGDAPASSGLRLHLTIARSSMLLAAALMVSLAIMLAVGLQLMRGMDAVADGWLAYDLRAATKADALSEVRGHLGLGGVIDLFHEYQVTGDPAVRASVERAISLARANLAIFCEVAPMTGEEEVASAAIAAALDAIGAGLPLVGQAVGAGRPASEVLHATGIEVRAAVQGLRTLNSQLSLERARLTSANLDGIQRLQRLMAWGGGIIGALVLVSPARPCG